MRLSLSWTSRRNWMSVAGALFIGGATGYVQTNLTAGLSGAMPWKQIIIGAAVMGGLSIFHLAQVPESTPSSNEKDGGKV